MFIAQRTTRRIRIAFLACFAYALVAILAAVAFPTEGKSFFSSLSWWAIGIPVGLLAYVAVELLSTWFLELTFWQRMPSWGRVLLLVALLSIVAIGVSVVFQQLGGYSAL